MAASIDTTLAAILAVGEPDAVAIAARDRGRRLGGPPPAPLRNNLHVHLPPNFSAFTSVEEPVRLAAEEGISCLGATNYYDFAVYGRFAAEARRLNVFPFFGVEVIAMDAPLRGAGVKVNDPGNPGRIYICGKGLTRFSASTMPEAARAAMGGIRARDAERMRRMISLMNAAFERGGVQMDLAEGMIVEMVVARSGAPRETVTLQERHVALAFQEAFFSRVGEAERAARLASVLGAPAKAANDAVKVQNDIRSHLMKAGRPACVEEAYPALDEAYRLVLDLGGIPCYPTLADGASPICAFEETPEKLISNLKALNIPCAEFIPARNDPAVLERYVLAMREAGLFVTAGTEHNSLDPLPMEPAASGGRAISERVKGIFSEGARVVAAHQFLAAHGRRGFVDASGAPDGSYANAEERIAAFAATGSVVIERYLGI